MGDPFVQWTCNSDPIPNVWGMVCVTGWNPEFDDSLASFQQEYESLIRFLCDSVPNITEYYHIYPYSALHTTIQTLIPFTRKEKLDAEQQIKLSEEWIIVLNEIFDSEIKNIIKDSINIKSIELRQSAGIILYHPNETIEKLRDLIDKAKNLAKSKYGNKFDCISLLDENIRPTIIHSTFIRNKVQPDSEIINKVNNAIHEFKNQNPSHFTKTVKVEKITLCEETVPYMQLISGYNSPKPLWEKKLS